MVTSYSMCQSLLNPEKVYNPYVHFLAGAIAGGVGSAVTMPLDVCKTLLNTQEAGVLKKLQQSQVYYRVIGRFIWSKTPHLDLPIVGGWPLGSREDHTPRERLLRVLPGTSPSGGVPGALHRRLLVRVRVL